MAVQFWSAVPISTKRVCLQDLDPSAATLLVHPLQLHEVVPSVYCRVSYVMFGFESEVKVQTRVICLVIQRAVNKSGMWISVPEDNALQRMRVSTPRTEEKCLV